MVKGDSYIARSGYVLIINNLYADWWSEREGTKKNIFAKYFGFTTREDINLTTRDMLKALRDTARRDFSNNDCFCCIIQSTEETAGGICGTDGDPIDKNTILSIFSSDTCPSLDGKPKIFVLEVSNTSAPFVTQKFDLPLTGRKGDAEFLVWSRFHDPYDIRGSEWWRFLSHGSSLREAIDLTRFTISLVSTLTKDVRFERKESPSQTSY